MYCVLDHVGLRGGGCDPEFAGRDTASIFDLSEYIGVLYIDTGLVGSKYSEVLYTDVRLFSGCFVWGDTLIGLFGSEYLEVPYTDVGLFRRCFVWGDSLRFVYGRPLEHGTSL